MYVRCVRCVLCDQMYSLCSSCFTTSYPYTRLALLPPKYTIRLVCVVQSCGNKVSLEVLHPPHAFTPSHPPHERMEYGRSGDLDMTSSGDPKAFQTFPPPPEYPYGATGRQPTGKYT